MKTSIYTRLIQKSISFIFIGTIVLSGCSDDSTDPVSGNSADCVVTSAPSYFGTPQNFTYDKSGNLSARTYEFGTAGYSPFIQSIDGSKLIGAYSYKGGTVEETNLFQGGTGNLYDGQPEEMFRTLHYTFADGTQSSIGPYRAMVYAYDDKKRLIDATVFQELQGGDVSTIYSRQLYQVKLEMVYNYTDDVTELKQTYVYREGVYNVMNPSESYFFYTNEVQTLVHYTYDNNPSPFTAVLKYWIFVQGDYGYVSNSNWQAIITALSKHNPTSIIYDVRIGKPSSFTTNLTYNYNAQGFPQDSYTYSCK